MKMKTFAACFAATSLSSLTPLWAQGPLSPSTTPSVTMKTLGQLQPRTPIESLPFVITESGSYYVTADLSSSNHGIQIRASHVTVDLMGFTLKGNGTSTVFGIFLDGDVDAPLNDITVLNGRVENFANGIRLEHACRNRLEALQIARSTSNGIIILANSGDCSDNQFVSCSSANNAGLGIYFSAKNCSVADNLIASCSSYGNSTAGIYLSATAGGSCEGNRILDSSIWGNDGYGIGFTAASNNVIQTCTIADQSAYGVMLAASGYNVVSDCTIARNAAYGIRCSSGSIGNRFERNQISATTGTSGIGFFTDAQSTNNLVVQNFLFGQATNLSFTADNIYGPAVTNNGALATFGPPAHPWANFSRP